MHQKNIPTAGVDKILLNVAPFGNYNIKVLSRAKTLQVCKFVEDCVFTSKGCGERDCMWD